MIPRSPRVTNEQSLSDRLAIFISSRYARYVLFALGTVYCLLGFVMPGGYRVIGEPEESFLSVNPMKPVKRAMKVLRPQPKPLTPQEQEHLLIIEQEMNHVLPVGLAKHQEGKVQHGIGSYLPSNHPVLDPNQASEEGPVNVRFLMGADVTTQTQFLVDGLERSRFIQLLSVTQYDSWRFTTWNLDMKEDERPVVWMADVESMRMDCHALQALVKHAQINAKEEEPVALVLMDYSGSSERLHCPSISNLIPKDRVRLTRRNIVHNRYWNPTTSWVEEGELAPNDGEAVSGGPILFQPHALRESFASVLSEALKAANWTNTDILDNSPVDARRERDVAHFWREHDYAHYTFLRRRVSEVVASLSGKYSRGREIHTTVSVQGDVKWVEVNEVQLPYVEHMIKTKVVVVSQRDEWEGNYRLLEALASGAMVMTDNTLALPDGLENATSIILYDSADSLEDLLYYFLSPKNDKVRLAIARKGWEVAMGRHRSWHRVEEVLWGKALTNVDQPFKPAPPKQERTMLSGEEKLIFEDMFDNDMVFEASNSSSATSSEESR